MGPAAAAGSSPTPASPAPDAPPESVEQQVAAAEAALQLGDAAAARAAAAAALSTLRADGAALSPKRSAEPHDQQSLLARAAAVLIQAAFQYDNRLLDLEQALSGVPLAELPLSVVLLWGVVAVELQASDAARATLGAYIAARAPFGEQSGVSRADALALSRLYAVQLLAGQCGDFDGAADWLEAGGAGLSEEQRDVRARARGARALLTGCRARAPGAATATR